MISVIIPPKENYFHCYAEGVLIDLQKKTNGETEVFLDENHPFILYYYFNHHARIYICCSAAICRTNNFTIYNVSKPFSIIGIIEGRRSFDRFKNAMDYLKAATNGEFYKLPVSYFYQLGYLCMNGKNSNLNLEMLTKRYNFTITYRKDIEWSARNF